jgi:hypothetical protein
MRSSGYPNFATVATIRGTSSGKELSFKGASIIHVEGDKIRSDECYFDLKALEKVGRRLKGFALHPAPTAPLVRPLRTHPQINRNRARRVERICRKRNW